MVLQSPGDTFFVVFGFPVYYYGVILAFACLVAVCVIRSVYSWVYSDEKGDFIWDAAPYVIISGIIGARLYYCIVNLDYYIFHPMEIMFMREGGLSIHGGLIAGILGLYLTSKKYKISFLRLLDIFSVGTVLAQSIGRWGNFFNNEAFGLPYEGILKLYIPPDFRPEGFEHFMYFHPAFLYESIADCIIFLILLFVIKHFGAKIEGLTLCLYFILYSSVRFFIEGIRLDSALNIGDLHIAQIVSIIVLGISVLGLICILLKSRGCKAD